jgi:hypothetical protein
VTVVPNRVELSDCRKIGNQNDLKDMMGEVLMNDLEGKFYLSPFLSFLACSLISPTLLFSTLPGLVLKGKNTTYSPGKRKWLKLKKDYLKGMADTADLVVLGKHLFFFLSGFLLLTPSFLVSRCLLWYWKVRFLDERLLDGLFRQPRKGLENSM